MTRDGGDEYFAEIDQIVHMRMESDRACQEIRRGCLDRLYTSNAAVAEASAALDAAREQLAVARALVDRTEADAGFAWHAALALGPARMVARAESLPASAGLKADEAERLLRGQSPKATVTRLLSGVHRQIERVRNGRGAGPADFAALVTLGALGALIGFVVARILMISGGRADGATGLVLSAVGRIITILSPMTGATGLHWLLARRGVHFGPGTLASVIAAGVVTATAAFLLMPSVG